MEFDNASIIPLGSNHVSDLVVRSLPGTYTLLVFTPHLRFCVYLENYTWIPGDSLLCVSPPSHSSTGEPALAHMFVGTRLPEAKQLCSFGCTVRHRVRARGRARFPGFSVCGNRPGTEQNWMLHVVVQRHNRRTHTAYNRQH